LLKSTAHFAKVDAARPCARSLKTQQLVRELAFGQALTLRAYSAPCSAMNFESFLFTCVLLELKNR
jgi:hypothetical protein